MSQAPLRSHRLNHNLRVRTWIKDGEPGLDRLWLMFPADIQPGTYEFELSEQYFTPRPTAENPIALEDFMA